MKKIQIFLMTLLAAAISISSCKKQTQEEPTPPEQKNEVVELLTNLAQNETQAQAADALKQKGYVVCTGNIFAPSADAKKIYTQYIAGGKALTKEQAETLGMCIELEINKGNLVSITGRRYYATLEDMTAGFAEQGDAQQEAYRAKSDFTHIYRLLEIPGYESGKISESMWENMFMLKERVEKEGICTYRAVNSKEEHWVSAKAEVENLYVVEVGVCLHSAMHLFSIAEGKQIAFTHAISNIADNGKHSLIKDLHEGYSSRLLNPDEWAYLTQRKNADGDYLWAHATLRGKKGVLLFPDGLNVSILSDVKVLGPESTCNDNIIASYADFSRMHDLGVVFLEAKGLTDDKGKYTNTNYCFYWTDAYDEETKSGLAVVFTPEKSYDLREVHEAEGASVRFVLDIH